VERRAEIKGESKVNRMKERKNDYSPLMLSGVLKVMGIGHSAVFNKDKGVALDTSQ
jgi:hypothetical protein